MSIAEHVHSLQQHLAQYGLYQVPANADREETEIFKICFLNKYEMQRWRELRESEQRDDRLSQKGEPDTCL
jgi:N-acetyl-anhydromuramyl-L-alanine amidase AmpD